MPGPSSALIGIVLIASTAPLVLGANAVAKQGTPGRSTRSWPAEPTLSGTYRPMVAGAEPCIPVRLMERLSRVDANTLRYEFTTEEPSLYARPPISIQISLARVPANETSEPSRREAC